MDEARRDIEQMLGRRGRVALAAWLEAGEPVQADFVRWVAWVDGQWRAERLAYIRMVAEQGELLYPLSDPGVGG